MILHWSAVHCTLLNTYLATLWLNAVLVATQLSSIKLTMHQYYGTLQSSDSEWFRCGAHGLQCFLQLQRALMRNEYGLYVLQSITDMQSAAEDSSSEEDSFWKDSCWMHESSIMISQSYHVVCVLHTSPNLNTWEIQHNKQLAKHAVQQHASHEQSLAYRLWAVFAYLQ